MARFDKNTTSEINAKIQPYSGKKPDRSGDKQ
jgi:hypothetical protein